METRYEYPKCFMGISKNNLLLQIIDAGKIVDTFEKKIGPVNLDSILFSIFHLIPCNYFLGKDLANRKKIEIYDGQIIVKKNNNKGWRREKCQKLISIDPALPRILTGLLYLA